MSDKIRKALIKLIEETIPVISFVAVVKDVNETEFTCDVEPIDGGAVYHDVRLKSTVDQDTAGLVCIPKKESYVIVSSLNNDFHSYYVSRFTTVVKWHLKIDSGSELVFDDQGNILFNSGSFGGLVKIDDLKTQWDAAMSAIKGAVQAGFISVDAALNAIASGSGQSTSAFNSSAASISNLNKTTLENSKVKHG